MPLDHDEQVFRFESLPFDLRDLWRSFLQLAEVEDGK
jgi:hypothetical protein